MEKKNIKVHLPWYARGTPVVNPRDGPQMANSDKPLFAIREGPSARGEPPDKFRLWLTLKTTFFNTKNTVYGQWTAQTRRVDKVIESEMINVQNPLRGARIIEDEMIYKPKTRRVDMIIDKINVGTPKPRRGVRIIVGGSIRLQLIF